MSLSRGDVLGQREQVETHTDKQILYIDIRRTRIIKISAHVADELRIECVNNFVVIW